MKQKSFLFFISILCFLLSFSELYGQTKLANDSIELDEVVVKNVQTGALFHRTSIIQTQKINAFEISRAACCNLSESFETNPSVDVSYSDAITGAKQIRLLGLDGEYVQLLTENFPNFRGLATPYGLDYIPGPWMESIQVSKGTSSVKNGYEAITGQINVEYKKPPVSDVLTANLFAADNGRIEANADVSLLLNKELSTGLFVHYSSEQKEMDNNDDYFLDTPLRQQFNGLNRWFFQNNNLISQLGVQYIRDKREGGQTKKANTNDPYKTDLDVNRVSFFTKNGYILDPFKNESLALIFTGSYQKQDSYFGLRQYDAKETTLYANLMYEKDLHPGHKLSTGLSLNYLNLEELFLPDRLEKITRSPDDTKETVGGAYVEYTYNRNDKFIVLAGLRIDYSSLFDFFATPRLHVKYNFTDWLHLRGTIGKGYRTAHILAENNYLLANSRQFNFLKNFDREEAWNYGLNIGLYLPVNEKELVINGEWYYTDFQKQIITDLDSNPHKVSFYLSEEKSYSSVFQIEASYPFFKGFNLTAAYRWMDVKATYGGVLKKKLLTSDYKALITASYQTPLRKWQFDFTTQFNGGGRMPDPDPENPLWDKTFSSYTIMNAQVSKFFRTWSIYGGVENLLDFTQENRIIDYENPWSSDFDATMIWGPVHGRKFYIGLRYNIPRF